MLTLKKIEKSKDAALYFSQDNYYTQKQGIEFSKWHGAIADELGLKGRINPEIFHNLLKGEIDGIQLGRIEKGQFMHRPGYDLTLSAPKSVSILSEVYNDIPVRNAHDKAVKQTLNFIESNYLQSRVNSNGKTHRIDSKNALFATFTHDVSRELDPQLHTHSVLINATKVGDQYKSITPDLIYKNQKILGKLYRQILANNLTQLGYKLRYDIQDKTLFEIDGISKDLINDFSERRNQIHQYFEDNNLLYDTTTAKQVALLTRRKKKDVDRVELQNIWEEKASKYPLPDNLKHRQEKALPLTSLNTVLDQAINHLSERNAAFTKEDLFETSLVIDVKINPVNLLSTIDQRIENGRLVAAPDHPDMKNKKSHYTTVGMIELEKALFNDIQRSKNQLRAIGKVKTITRQLNKTHFNDQQKNAVLQALQSKDRVFGIQGDPGVGKTTLLAEYKNIVKKQGYNVLAMASSYQAVDELSKSLNIQGVVVDRFLVDERLHNKRPGRENKNIWIVDEVSMLDTAKMHQIVEESIKQNARVLLVGDHKQLESVGAGRAFYQLQENGMDYAIVNKRIRQKTELLKSVVADTIDNRFDQAIETLHDHGSIKEHAAESVALKAAADTWLSLEPNARDQAAIIAPANDQKSVIDGFIREALINEKVVSAESVTKNVLVDSYLTNQQKKITNNYRIGDVIRFNESHVSQDKKRNNSVRAYEYFTVKGVSERDNKLVLKSHKGSRLITVDPSKYVDLKKGGIQHYGKETIEIASGDQMRWMDNKNKYSLKRNTKLTVERVSQNFIRVRENKSGVSHRIDTGKDTLLHVSHNYSKTAFAVQGETVKHAILVADSKRSNTLNRKSFLVAVTRASEKVTLITDNMKKLSMSLILRSGKNTVAIDKQGLKSRKQSSSRPPVQKPTKLMAII